MGVFLQSVSPKPRSAMYDALVRHVRASDGADRTRVADCAQLVPKQENSEDCMHLKIASATLVSLCLTLAACGGGGGSSAAPPPSGSGPSPSPPPAPAPTPTPTPTPTP